MMFILGCILVYVAAFFLPGMTTGWKGALLAVVIGCGVGFMVVSYQELEDKINQQVKSKPEIWVYDTWLEIKVKDIPNEGNNPGCITAGYDKYDTLAIGFVRTGAYKFLVFPDSATGWKALRMRIEQSKDENVISFLKNYCVNIPESYIFAVLAATGGKETDNVGDLSPEIIARTIAKYEGWKKGKDYPLRKR